MEDFNYNQMIALVSIAGVILLFALAVIVHVIIAMVKDRARIASDNKDYAIGLEKTDWEVSLEDQYKGEAVIAYPCTCCGRPLGTADELVCDNCVAAAETEQGM